jgi:hypothetical protein
VNQPAARSRLKSPFEACAECTLCDLEIKSDGNGMRWGKIVSPLTQHYGLIVIDECHHVPAAAFENAVRQIPAKRWLGLTATPYRRDKLALPVSECEVAAVQQ